jgi:hypothetical protein
MTGKPPSDEKVLRAGRSQADLGQKEAGVEKKTPNWKRRAKNGSAIWKAARRPNPLDSNKRNCRNSVGPTALSRARGHCCAREVRCDPGTGRCISPGACHCTDRQRQSRGASQSLCRNAEWRRLCCAKTPETNIAGCVGAGQNASTADGFRAAF